MNQLQNINDELEMINMQQTINTLARNLAPNKPQLQEKLKKKMMKKYRTLKDEEKVQQRLNNYKVRKNTERRVARQQRRNRVVQQRRNQDVTLTQMLNQMKM